MILEREVLLLGDRFLRTIKWDIFDLWSVLLCVFSQHNNFCTLIWNFQNRVGLKNGKMVFAKLKNFFAKLIFFPAKLFLVQKDFPLPKYQKKFWRKKNQLSKKGRSLKNMRLKLGNSKIFNSNYLVTTVSIVMKFILKISLDPIQFHQKIQLDISSQPKVMMKKRFLVIFIKFGVLPRKSL
jgi:hypothetical protein